MPLKVLARLRCSALPSTLARTLRSPSATPAAASSSRFSGPAIWRAMKTPAARPRVSTSRPIAARPRIARRVARATASTLCVIRTAPTVRPASAIGTAVARISWPSVSLWRRSWKRSPPSAVAISGRAL